MPEKTAFPQITWSSATGTQTRAAHTHADLTQTSRRLTYPSHTQTQAVLPSPHADPCCPAHLHKALPTHTPTPPRQSHLLQVRTGLQCSCGWCGSGQSLQWCLPSSAKTPAKAWRGLGPLQLQWVWKVETRLSASALPRPAALLRGLLQAEPWEWLSQEEVLSP